MTAIMFLMALASVFAVWAGWRRLAMATSMITMILAAAWFFHHVTDPININL